MKKKILSLLLVISVALFSINLIPVIGTPTSTTSTQQTIDTVWQVGDWVSYEAIVLFAIQYNFTVIEVTPDYVEFMLNENASDTVKINATVMDDPFYNTTNPFSTPFQLNLSVFGEFPEVNPFFYESHALVHIDGNPTVIPVTGVAYEYSNISETQPYNYTTYNWTYPYSYETTLVQMHTNYSIQLEIHEPTGILVNMLTTAYSNVTMSLFDIPYSAGTYLHIIDSHGVFVSSEEPTTTKNTPYGLGIIGIALIGIACIYIRRRRTHTTKHED